MWRARLWIPYRLDADRPWPADPAICRRDHQACDRPRAAVRLAAEDAEEIAAPRPRSLGDAMSPTTQGAIVLIVTLVVLLSGAPVAFGLGAIAIAFLVMFQGLDSLRRRGGDVLLRPARFHAGFDPDVRDDGRGDRLLARRQGSLRGARPLALPHARRARDLQSRRLRDLRRAHRLVAGLLRRHRQDGHSGDAPARLSGRRRHRLDLRRRHARHSDPAVDHLHPLRHRHRNLDRPAVPRGRDAGPDADRPVHAVDGLHHLEARVPLARHRFPL